MRAELKSVGCTDCEDLAAWRPQCDKWMLPLCMWCGPQGGEGEESFVVVVCSAEWVCDRVSNGDVFDGMHYLVVDGFRWGQIFAYLEKRVTSCEGGSWEEVASKLGRLGHWEFEDYQP